MGVLAPLYLAAIAAVGLPILFHMIRRTPRGRVPFSTLMFLEATPPRATNRSRIEHWLLLLLRALALALLAFAFSRPFLRQAEELALDEAGRRVAVLIDTSASMRREGLWEQAVASVNSVLDEVTERDSVAIFAFDRELRPVLGFEEWQGLGREVAVKLAKQKTGELTAGWSGTDLGRVLPEAVTAALDRFEGQAQASHTELIVISDLQRGSRCDVLQVFDWPDSVRVEVKLLKIAPASNASVQVVGTSVSEDGLRVRVDNAEDSDAERFGVRVEGLALNGEGGSGGTTKERVIDDVFVPSNQNRVVKFAELAEDDSHFRILLSGDEVGFDNEAWFVRPAPARVRVEYFGDGTPSDPQDLRYYVERALLPTEQRVIDFVAGADADFASINDGTLTIVSQLLDKSQSELIQKRVSSGRSVIVVGATQDVCRQAFELAGIPAPEITEASVEGYAMLSDVDTSHSLFAPFHDAKLADFTKLPIWKHRSIETPATDTFSPIRVLARFDGGKPAIVELAEGEGRVTLFLFGWHAPDSRFVLWSKFVPLLNAVVDEIATGSFEPTRLIVGDKVPVSKLVGDSTKEVRVTLPSGTQSTISDVGNAELNLEQPGIYEISWQSDAGSRTASLAVNLDPQESRTGPIELDELRKLGVPLAEDAEESLSHDEKRQLQAQELESRQRNWQWIILAGVLLLLLETWIAGRLSRGAEAVEL